MRAIGHANDQHTIVELCANFTLTIFLVNFLDLEDEMSSLYYVEIELMPVRCGGKFGTRELRKRVEI
jgi:hypothetical protein